MIRKRGYLSSERQKLLRQLDALERNFEAKSKVYIKHSEEKKLEKAKKEFQIKREIIETEIASIDENIKKIETQQRIDEDISYKREWEKIKSELIGYPDKDFRDFIKQFALSCIKLKRPLLNLDELFHEIELPDETIRKSLSIIRSNGYGGVCGIRVDDNFITTQFYRELSKI